MDGFEERKLSKIFNELYSLIHLSQWNIPKALLSIHSSLKRGRYVYVDVHGAQLSEGLYDEPLDLCLKIFLNIFPEQGVFELIDY